jgi:hypothetical protein
MTAPTPTAPVPHADLGALASLLGTWRGRGDGHYPTIEPFSYIEEVVFSHVGRPFLAYVQRTRHPEAGTPMHAELGYLRPAAGGRAEWMLAHPTGIVEVEEGDVRVEGGVVTVTLAATTVAGSATAKAVRTLRRMLRVEGDVLRYDLWMGYGGVVDGHHLAAELVRVDA